MPTYATTERFQRDFESLDSDEKERFRSAVGKFVEDLAEGKFRSGLRVKGVKGATGVFEMTWAPDGRATFEYGDEIVEGERHVIWRRVGTHGVLTSP